MFQLLIFIILLFILFGIVLFMCKRCTYYSIDKFTNEAGCKNTPPNFNHEYSELPNMYKIAPLPAPPLGANGTMVVMDKGSCVSNINGVNKVAGIDSPYRWITNTAKYCVEGSDNVFNLKK